MSRSRLSRILPRDKKIKYEVSKEQVPLILDNYVNYMSKKKKISGGTKRTLINFEKFLLLEAKPPGTTITVLKERPDDLIGIEILEFLEKFKSDVTEALCSNKCTDKMRNLELFYLFAVSNIPHKLYKEWLGVNNN